MNRLLFDEKAYAMKARQAVAEGMVVLKNDRNTLPLHTKETISVFGRSQFHYYKSGTGSGGLVNTRYVTGILDALESCDTLTVNPNVKAVYEAWISDHPFDAGSGWAEEPWSQEEMPVDTAFVERARAESDAALIIIGRSAGEDKDARANPGSYLLTETEENLIRLVSSSFPRTIVLINAGNIIDMKWVQKYDPAAVAYVWQGGQEGGSGVLDILTGRVSPSGKLPDTIAYDISDYPSTANFGDEHCNTYAEDIYVGYRYFETFAPDKVLYPFGFGLSYTTFDLRSDSGSTDAGSVSLHFTVTNTGNYEGKEVVQVYVEAPQGELGKPARSLCAYVKTSLLKPGESERITITCSAYDMASYDERGITGYRFAYVLESGTYSLYAGSDVRSAAYAGSFQIPETICVNQLSQALAPVIPFQRMKPKKTGNGYDITYEAVPLRNTADKITANRPADIRFTGDQGFTLSHAADNETSLEEFIAQLSDQDLITIVRGEGMNSPKVTAGTGGAFGGVTESLLHFGIPAACCTDGPSGIRMDCGNIAFSIPNGTCLASTFNDRLLEELYEWEGMELRKNKVDVLLGPGINLHRSPLCGRNFEYFSEDPLLTGKMAAAQLRGMHRYGVTGTIKHFACNNQEFHRHDADSVLSERAARELYLKSFEIAVREGGAYCIMSSYNPVNGFWTASNYDLLTRILREEWGFTGLVMTDWWAKGNDEGQPGSTRNMSAIVRSQNDLYMVTQSASDNTNHDNLEEGLRNGWVTRGELQRSAMNICRVLLRLPVMNRVRGIITPLDQKLAAEAASEDYPAFYQVKNFEMEDVLLISPAQIGTQTGAVTVFHITAAKTGMTQLKLTMRSSVSSGLAQLPVSVFLNNDFLRTITLTGAEREWKDYSISLGDIRTKQFDIRLFFAQSGLELGECKIIIN